MRNIMLDAPVERGQFLSLKDCGEDFFASGAMGRGAAVSNTNGRIVSPFSGRVLKVFRNAISIVSDNGINLFVQVGDDAFYEVRVNENQQINSCQLLAYFNINRMEGADSLKLPTKCRTETYSTALNGIKRSQSP